MFPKTDDRAREPIRAERATVRFFDGLEVEGYRMPSGEFRVGITGASRVLGYAENWLYRTLTRKGNKSLKVLQGLGFDAYTIEAEISRPQGGTTTVRTLSLGDFNTLILYAAFNGKKAALALQKALTTVALNDFFRDAFQEPPLSTSGEATAVLRNIRRNHFPRRLAQHGPPRHPMALPSLETNPICCGG